MMGYAVVETIIDVMVTGWEVVVEMLDLKVLEEEVLDLVGTTEELVEVFDNVVLVLVLLVELFECVMEVALVLLVEVFDCVMEVALVLLVEVFECVVDVEVESPPSIHWHQVLSGGNTGPAPSHAVATQSVEPAMILSRFAGAQPHSKSPGVQSFAAWALTQVTAQVGILASKALQSFDEEAMATEVASTREKMNFILKLQPNFK